MKIINVENFDKNLNSYLEETISSMEPLTIRTKKSGDVVVLSKDYYDKIMNVLEENGLEVKNEEYSKSDFLIKDDVLLKYSGKLRDVFVPLGVKEIGNEAFMDNEKVKTITLPEGVKKIGSKAFYSCIRLEKVFIPPTVEYVGEYAFYNCKKLKKVFLPKGIEEIYEGTFEGCESFKKIKIPDSIRYIDSCSFKDCTCLEKINVPFELRNIGNNAFYHTKIESFTFDSGVTFDSLALYGCPVWTIYGYYDSFAYEYAKENGIDFEEV